MKTFIALIFGLAGLAFFGFGAFDFWATKTNFAPYLDQYRPQDPSAEEMLAWAQAFPLWRDILWGVTAGAATLGALLLLFRAGVAASLFWLAVLTGIAGLGGDIAVLGGQEIYGQNGLIFSGALIGVTLVFAMVAGIVKRD